MIFVLFQILSHQAGLELFNVPHPAFHRVNSPLHLSSDFLKKHEELKRAVTQASPQFRGSHSPATDEDSSHAVMKASNKRIASPKNSPKNSPKIAASVIFSESIRKDAEKEMEEYLLKFGGVPSNDTVKQGSVTQPGEDNENDGDDEGASRDSGL